MVVRKPIQWRGAFASLFLALALAACNTSSVEPTPTQLPTAASTELASPTVAAVQATKPVPTSTLPTSTTRLVVQLPDNSVQLVDTSGNTTPLAKLGGQVDSASLLLAQNTVGSAIYLSVAGQSPGVMQVDANGAHMLDWIQGPVNGLAVSATHIAWGMNDPTANPPTAELLISRLDGSQVTSVLKETYTGIPQTLRPLRWTQGGERLYFSKEPSGLGGYILFGGITNIWSYDLSDGKMTEAVQPDSKNALVCIDDLSPNEQLVADHCNGQTMVVTNLADKKKTTINPPPNIGPAGAAGGARFSPNNSTLAYALARRDPENEQGWVAVTNGFSGDSKLVATSPTKDYFWVAAWLDADTLVLQSGLQTPGVWIVRTDGTGLKRLSDGKFLGLIGGAG
jgi:hypothetical protein